MSPQTTDAPRPTGWGFWLRPDVLVALTAIVILLPASLAVLAQQPPADGVTTALLAGAAALLLAAPLAAARHPLVGFAAATAVMAALALLPAAVAASAALYPSGVGYLLCLGQVASRSARPWIASAWASGLFGAALIAFTIPQFGDGVPAEAGLRIGVFGGLAAAVTAATAVGLLLRARRVRAEERTQARVREAIDAERMRINRDLHDVVAHAMTVMLAQADVARAVLRDDPPRADRALHVVTETGRDALRGMRAAVRAEPDAATRPAASIADLPALVDAVRSPVCDVVLEEQGARRALTAPASLALHHVVREGLTNAVRHTRHPVRITVRLEWSDADVLAVVADDGGAGPTTVDVGGGSGLVGLEERVRSVGGVLTAGPGRGGGWALRARLPVTEGRG